MTDDYVRHQDEQERQRQEGSGDTLSTSQGSTTVRLTPMHDAPPRRLYRSTQNRVLAGVAGGIAEYLHVDPTLTRILLFLALLPTGPFGVVIYAVLAFIILSTPGGVERF